MTYKCYKMAEMRILYERSSLWMIRIAVFISHKPGSEIKEVADAFNISYKTAHRHLRKLRELGILFVKLQGKESSQKYYPNLPEREDFFKLACSLLDDTEKIKSFFNELEPYKHGRED